MTFKLAFATDLHLNFVHQYGIEALCRSFIRAKPDALVITGDISEAPYIVDHLGFLDLNMKAQCPIFFILGNHDYYHATSIGQVREVMKNLFTYPEEYKTNLVPRLGWLGSSGVIPLTDKVALIGHDGWYDGQYANWFSSKVWLNDYILIGDFAGLTKNEIYSKINALSKESADYIEEHLAKALTTFEHVVVATHVSPFRENSVYDGKVSDNDWMPHFSSKHMGDVLLAAATKNQNKNITVLCGHSHGKADNMILPNLRCITGEAKYRNPKLNAVYEF